MKFALIKNSVVKNVIEADQAFIDNHISLLDCDEAVDVTGQAVGPGYSYVNNVFTANSPVLPDYSETNLIQSQFAKISIDCTTTSSSFKDIGNGLSIDFSTVTGTKLDIFFNASVSTTNENGQEVDFQVLIDNIIVAGCATGTKSSDVPQAASIFLQKTDLNAGSHTINVQWKTNGSTAQIRPVKTILEGATLLIQEVYN